MARHVLVTVLSLPPRRGDQPLSVSVRLVILPSPFGCGLGPRGYSFSRPQRVHFCYGPVTRGLPWRDLVDRLQSFSFHHLCYPNYGALTFTPAGLSPAEHASLTWTHPQTKTRRSSATSLRLDAPCFRARGCGCSPSLSVLPMADLTQDFSSQLHQLIAKVARRDRRAFAELYNATAPPLFGVALRIIRRQDLAEEVLQESFVAVWNARETTASPEARR